MFSCKPKIASITAIQFAALLSSIIHFSDVVALNVLDAIPHHTNSPILSFQQQQGLGPASLPHNYSEVAGQCYGNYLQAYNFSLDASGTLPSFRAFVNTVRDSKDTVEILCELYNATHDCITTNVGTFSTYFGVFMTLTGGDQENALMYYLFFAAAEYRCHVSNQDIQPNVECFFAREINGTMNQQLEQCTETERRVSSDEEACSAIRIAARCDRSVYRQSCGRGFGEAMCSIWMYLAYHSQDSSDCLTSVRDECNSSSCYC